MTTTTFPLSDPLTWKQADTDVHVATRGGEFAGFVEFDGSVHLVRDARGVDIGTFIRIDDARDALETAGESARPARGFSLPRALMRRPRRARA